MRYFHLPGPKKKGTKWYSVHLQPDLFGGTHLISRWGRVGSAKVSQSIDRYGLGRSSCFVVGSIFCPFDQWRSDLNRTSFDDLRCSGDDGLLFGLTLNPHPD